MIYEELYRESLKHAKQRIWIFSDLQQRDPEKAKECLEICMADFAKMGSPADMIWYLGDGVEGANLEHLARMSEMQEKAFAAVGVPLCYVLGNHDLECSFSRLHREKEPIFPFYETVKKHPGWHTTSSYEDWYFKVPVFGHTVYFLSDHIAKDKSWVYYQGVVRGNYPHFDRADRLRAEIAAEKNPVITASHYSYFGGNRGSEMQSRLFPLPKNLRIHFYGHAHIGDYTWARQDAYRRICWVDWHDVPQINVSSFEHIRGKICRSVFLHLYEDGTYGVFFRNHDSGVFSECYFPSNHRGPSKYEEEMQKRGQGNLF